MAFPAFAYPYQILTGIGTEIRFIFVRNRKAFSIIFTSLYGISSSQSRLAGADNFLYNIIGMGWQEKMEEG